MADSKPADETTTTSYEYPSLPLPDTELTLEEEEVANVRDEKNNDGNENDEEKEREKPLLKEVTIEIKPDPEDTPTLPLPFKKKEIDDKQKAKLSKHLFPFTRIKDAWSNSSNVFQFLGRATCIIFQTVGWFTCVGGIPFFSLVMLIIGSIYVDECTIQPNIPVYLIVSGVFGTIQHFLTFWILKVPKVTEGRLKVYRSYCRVINGSLHLFLIIWFIAGCIWVYGAFSRVDVEYPEKEEYCHKTLYYFSFWMLNVSFMLLALLLSISMCFLLCIR